MSGSGSRGTFVHLYLNGLYWGMYNIVERPDEAFMASYFGGSKEDWQAISHDETLTNTSERFKFLHQLAAEGGLEDPERYALVQSYLDIPHFIDYHILNWYAGNLDWAFNNWYAGTHHTAGPVRYFVWDGERTWYEGAEIYMELDEYDDQPNLVKPLFEALLANTDFRIQLADHLYKHLFNDGPLSQANTSARWLQINGPLEQAIIAESVRWGILAQTRHSPNRLASGPRRRIATNGRQWAEVDLPGREAGYYPPTDPPRFSPLNGEDTDDKKVALNMPATSSGIIYFTTDGSDPRQQQTGAVSPQATRYSGPLDISAPAHIKARILSDGTWSALTEAVFSHNEQATASLRITEIMYHPSGGSDFEFLELKNSGSLPATLANLSISGIDFTFPPAQPALAPGEFAILVSNPTAFAERYPGVPISGVYKGRLSNKGERLTLKTADGQTLLSLDYDDQGGWPLSPDGRGDSLVLIEPAGDPADPQNWRASAAINGTPGDDEAEDAETRRNP